MHHLQRNRFTFNLSMGFAYKFHNPDGVYFVTTATVDWVVDSPERYIYSTAKDYYGEKGILPVMISDDIFYA